MMSVSPSGQAEGMGVEPSSPRGRTTLAPWPGQPYPATFRQVRGVGIEPTVSSFQGWRITAFLPPDEWTAGELNPDFLGANQASSRIGPAAQTFERSAWDLNPACLLTEEGCRHNADLHSDPGRTRTFVSWV